MPKGDWRIHLALGGCVVAILLSVGHYAPINRVHAQDAQTSDADTQQNPKPADSEWGYKDGKPENYQAICAQPQSHDDADLCQQWRTAEAAEKQLYLSGFALLGLALTVGLGFWSALESRRSATAAMRAAAVAEQQAVDSRENFQRMERPYIYVTNVRFPPRKIEHGIDPLLPHGVFYDVANYGKTPATFYTVYTSAGFDIRGEPAHGPLEDSDYRLFAIGALAADTVEREIEKRFDQQVGTTGGVIMNDAGFRFTPFIPTNRILLFQIEIFYEGPFSKNHITAGLWRYDEASISWVRTGGDQYNYMR